MQRFKNVHSENGHYESKVFVKHEKHREPSSDHAVTNAATYTARELS